MNTLTIIAACSIALAFAGVAYGLWQLRRVAMARHDGEELLAAAQEASAVAAGRLEATERALKRVNERFDAVDASLVAERKAHAITKGLLTKARNQLSAQAEAAATQEG